MSATRNDAILERMIPFLVVTPNHTEHLDHAPMGLQVAPENVIDPMKLGSERFLHALQTLDRLTFGPEGMPMPRWVFYDCAEIPGAIFGFGMRARDLPADVTEALGIGDTSDALVPLSMYIAIPMLPPAVWFGHNLASLNPVFPALQLKGLASMTKAYALAAFRCGAQIGATQWDSHALFIHTRFGPLELLTAWTPAHSECWTLTYRFEVTEPKLRHALGDPTAAVAYPSPDFEVRADDHAAMQALQRRIEAGERFAVAGPPKGPDSRWCVPIASLP